MSAVTKEFDEKKERGYFGASSERVAKPREHSVSVGQGFFFTKNAVTAEAGLIHTNGNMIDDSELTSNFDDVSTSQHYRCTTTSKSFSSEVSAAAKVSGSFFGASVSTSVESMVASQTSSTSVGAFIQAFSRKGYYTLKKWENIRLSPHACDLLGVHYEDDHTTILQPCTDSQKLLKFIDYFNYFYVEGYVKGGNFEGRVNVETRSEARQTSVAAKVKATYGSTNVKGEFSAAISEAKETEKVIIDGEAHGANITTVVSNAESVFDALNEFLEAMKDDAQAGEIQMVSVVPWSVCPEIYKAVDASLLEKYFPQGSVNQDTVAALREVSSQAAYFNQVSSAALRNYSPGGKFSYFVEDESKPGLHECLDNLQHEFTGEDSVLQKGILQQLEKISLQELYETSLPAVLLDLQKKLVSLEENWAALSKRLLSIKYMRVSIYQHKGGEHKWDTFRHLRVTGLETQEAHEHRSRWSPIYDDLYGFTSTAPKDKDFFLANTRAPYDHDWLSSGSKRVAWPELSQ